MTKLNKNEAILKKHLNDLIKNDANIYAWCYMQGLLDLWYVEKFVKFYRDEHGIESSKSLPLAFVELCEKVNNGRETPIDFLKHMGLFFTPKGGRRQ